jgi:small-conductance mechanosensitive channel
LIFFQSLWPVFLVGILQISIFYLIEPSETARSLFLALTLCFALLGFVWRLQHYLWLSERGTSFLKRLKPSARKILYRSLQWFFLFWMLEAWFVEILQGMGVNLQFLEFLAAILGFGLATAVTIFMHHLLGALRSAFHPFNKSGFHLLLDYWAFGARIAPFSLYFIFLVNPVELQAYLMPVFWTLLFLPCIPFLYYALRQLRLFYFKRVAHLKSQSLFHKIMRNKASLERLLKIVAYLVGLIVISEVWDARIFQWLRSLFGASFIDQIEDTLFFFIGAWFLIYIGDRLLISYLHPKLSAKNVDNNPYLAGRLQTLLSISRTLLRIIILLTLLFIILARWGQDLTILLAIFGAFTFAISVAAQSFVKDFIAGILILADNSLLIGDWVDLDGKRGAVEELGLRTLRLRADNGLLFTIPYGHIQVIGNRNRIFSCMVLNVPFPYDIDPEEGIKVLESAHQLLRKTPAYRKLLHAPIEIRGIETITGVSIVFQVKLEVAPQKQEIVRRAYNRALLETLREMELTLPSGPQLVMAEEGSVSLLKK